MRSCAHCQAGHTLIQRVRGTFQRVLHWVGELARQASSNTFIELQWYLFSLVFLLGAAYALKTGAHVRVDIFYNRISPTAKAWVNIAGTVVFLIPFCLLMISTSWPVVVDSWIRLEGSPDPGGLPRYPPPNCCATGFYNVDDTGIGLCSSRSHNHH